MYNDNVIFLKIFFIELLSDISIFLNTNSVEDFLRILSLSFLIFYHNNYLDYQFHKQDIFFFE